MTSLTKAEWRAMAYEVVETVAKQKTSFTPDDIWAAGLPKPDEARALGHVMTRAKKNGLIQKSGRVQPTKQPESHGTDVTIWNSLIYEQGN